MRALAAPTDSELDARSGRGDREAGLSVRELADRLKAAGLDRGLGFDTLTDIERGERRLYQQEARSIAEVCGIPYEFFVFDPDELATDLSLDARIAPIEAKIDEMADQLGAIEMQIAAIAAAQEPQTKPAAQSRTDNATGTQGGAG